MTEKVSVGGASGGFFGRGSDVYRGGPPEGVLQHLHPGARVLGLVVVLLGVSFCNKPLLLLGVFTLAVVMAIASYLNLKSIYRTMLVPVVLLALPAWLVASFWYSGVETGSIFFLRTLGSVAVVAVVLHSVGIRNLGRVLEFFRAPYELRQIWTIMVAQVASFSGLIADMSLARKARQVGTQKKSAIRKQVGRQAGVLFSRTWHRGNELAFAMDSRTISDRSGTKADHNGFRAGDYVFLVVCAGLFVGLVIT